MAGLVAIPFLLLGFVVTLSRAWARSPRLSAAAALAVLNGDHVFAGMVALLVLFLPGAASLTLLLADRRPRASRWASRSAGAATFDLRGK